MVIALDSGSSGTGSNPGREYLHVSWARHFTRLLLGVEDTVHL